MDDAQNVTEQGTEQAPVEQTGSAPAADEVTTLRSRITGYTAKVNELTSTQKALQKERDDLAARLAEIQKGTVDKDEALRSQMAVRDAEIEALRKEAALAKIEAKYPETFAVLGEAAANLTPEALAEAEARFKGVAAETNTPPKPIGNNPPRTQGGASSAQTNPDGATLDQLRKKVYGMIPGAGD